MAEILEIICDNCEVPFDVDPDEVGEKVECPECGDVNRVPDGEFPSGDGPEEDLMIVRPAMFRSKPVRYVIMVLAVLGGVVLAIWGGMDKQAWAVWGGSAWPRSGSSRG